MSAQWTGRLPAQKGIVYVADTSTIPTGMQPLCCASSGGPDQRLRQRLARALGLSNCCVWQALSAFLHVRNRTHVETQILCSVSEGRGSRRDEAHGGTRLLLGWGAVRALVVTLRDVHWVTRLALGWHRCDCYLNAIPRMGQHHVPRPSAVNPCQVRCF